VIAILAAIAVPNFLEAQTRSKVARVKNDHRILATAMEAYLVDHNVYPPDQDNDITDPVERGFLMLTTPVAYITSLQRDPFSPPFDPSMSNAMNIAAFYYMASGSDNARENDPAIGTENAYAVISIGPDREDDSQNTDPFPYTTNFDIYDPTNGSSSHGDILRLGGSYEAGSYTFEGVHHGLWGLGPIIPR
jgi:type II secretory pathway pseudopilin PulG